MKQTVLMVMTLVLGAALLAGCVGRRSSSGSSAATAPVWTDPMAAPMDSAPMDSAPMGAPSAPAESAPPSGSCGGACGAGCG